MPSERRHCRHVPGGKNGFEAPVMERSASAIGGLLGLVLVVAQFIFWVGSATGIVYEICLDPDRSAPGRIEVEGHWTYIVFPPLILSSIDPPGRCVRNTPLHQGLSAVGVWKLPSPEVQVERHLESQVAPSARPD